MNNDIVSIVNDPSWLLHRYDPGYDSFQLRRVDRARRREATFLLDQYLGEDDVRLVLRRGDVATAVTSGSIRRHYLFHSAFCCSTLLANAIDVPGSASVLKEPPVLNDLVGWARRYGGDGRVRTMASDILSSLCRPFRQGEWAVIKPSNVVNPMASVLMDSQAESRAILMYAPLETFVLSVAKKGIDGRLWGRRMFHELRQDGIADFGHEGVDLLGLADLQVAASGWLVQQRHFHRLLSSGPERYRTLRSDVLLSDPSAAIAAIGRLFALEPGTAGGDHGDASAFGRHSKTGSSFSAERREEEYAAAAGRYGDEVGETMAWARRVADAHDVVLDLPLPLTEQRNANERGGASPPLPQ